MSCDTWFENRTKDIPNKHLEIIKKQLHKDEKLYCQYPTFKDWIISETDEDLLIDIYRRLDNAILCKDESAIQYFKKIIHKATDPAQREWKKSEWKKYWHKRKKIKSLLTKKFHKNELLSIFKEELILFDNGYYDLSYVNEYYNNFRIYDYDAEPWCCVDDFLKYIKDNPNSVWIKRYNENNEYVEIPRQEAEQIAIGIVTEFFQKYPNGRIRLG